MDEKQKIERLDLDTFLACLAVLENFRPSLIEHQDKPDFIITVTSAGKKIGVETTRSVYQEVVRAMKSFRFTECRDSLMNLTHLKDGEKRRSKDDLLASVTNFSSPWKKSEESASEWKNKIARALTIKRQKLNQAGFRSFDENWLLIHDEPRLPNQNLVQYRAERDLNALFLEPSGVARDFDRVFIHSGLNLFRWHNQKVKHCTCQDIGVG